jgi:sterol desaturase/sphingolipid hydroxylase (fatty acid hydroxylase superfamily)
MFYIYIILSILGGWIFAEIVGYYLHILLHSGKIAYLSRNHMIHHLKIYAPKKKLRPDNDYRGSVEDRASLIGIGMEWIGPIALAISASWVVFWVLNIPMMYWGIFTISGMVWGYLMFSYMHDAMHLKDFWMEKNPLTRKWFLKIRRLHDIHHMNISDDGRMLTNYGICFFFLDRMAGSLAQSHKSFNEKGHQAALERYADIIN